MIGMTVPSPITLVTQKHLFVALALLITTSSLTASEAFYFANRVSELPNNSWGYASCHISLGGAGPRTMFGEDVFMFGSNGNSIVVNWSAVCGHDSDGDGASNGNELGDPGCIWRTGDPNHVAMITDPNDPENFPESKMSGDGMVEGDATIIPGNMFDGRQGSL